jgi:transposase
LDKKQVFRQSKEISGKAFIQYLRCLKRTYRKFVLFYDGAPWHKSKAVREFFRDNSDSILPVMLPRCSPDLNPVEERWGQGKNEIVGSVYPPSFDELKEAVTEYYRTKRFNLELAKYLYL